MSRAIDVRVADCDAAIANQLSAALRTRYAVAPPVTDLGQLGAALAKHKPRALLIGATWPDGSVVPRFTEFFAANPGLRICVVAPQLTPSAITLALAQGARGFLTLPPQAGALTGAVASILTGEVYIPAEMWRAVAGDKDPRATPVVRRAIIAHEPGSPEYRRSVAWISHDRQLTWRQAEASLGVRDGYSEKQIAARMGCSSANVHALLDQARARLASFGVQNGASLSAAVEMSLAAMPLEWGHATRSERSTQRAIN